MGSKYIDVEEFLGKLRALGDNKLSRVIIELDDEVINSKVAFYTNVATDPIIKDKREFILKNLDRVFMATCGIEQQHMASGDTLFVENQRVWTYRDMTKVKKLRLFMEVEVEV